MSKKRVLVGMSGGIDSSLTALILKQQGYEVLGATFIFYPQDEQHIALVKNIANEYGIRHMVVRKEADFQQQVIQKFINDYIQGYTPSICLHCNPAFKFPSLIEAANQCDCQYIATGHYVKTVQENGQYYLERGVDAVKDQSYFLWKLPQDVLFRLITPLGEYTKEEIRTLAKNLGFTHLVSKKESMGVCFLQRKDYREFLRGQAPNVLNSIGKGWVLDQNGKEVGTHDGYPYYTIGQKRGLHLECSENLVVIAMDPKKNILFAGPDKLLYTNRITLRDPLLKVPIEKLFQDDIRIMVRGYGRNPSLAPKDISLVKNKLSIHLQDDAWAMAPGQPVVIYKGNRVVAGGTFEKSPQIEKLLPT